MSESNAKTDRQNQGGQTVNYVPVPGQPVPPATPIYNTPAPVKHKKANKGFSSAQPGANVDAPSTALAILSFFFPLVGAFFWLFFWLYGYYHKASSCRNGALVGLVVWIVALILAFIIWQVVTPGNTSQVRSTSPGLGYTFSF
ncbi:MAG: hypothetical protein LBL67_01030 [Coriobacteriales bacterium]|jgi:hypothetical protein|nr:hypothetical protein [Coriobacteriales bacterium]